MAREPGGRAGHIPAVTCLLQAGPVRRLAGQAGPIPGPAHLRARERKKENAGVARRRAENLRDQRRVAGIIDGAN